MDLSNGDYKFYHSTELPEYLSVNREDYPEERFDREPDTEEQLPAPRDKRQMATLTEYGMWTKKLDRQIHKSLKNCPHNEDYIEPASEHRITVDTRAAEVGLKLLQTILWGAAVFCVLCAILLMLRG